MLIYIYGLPVLEQMYSLPDGCDRTPLFTSSVCLAVSLAVYSVQCTVDSVLYDYTMHMLYAVRTTCIPSFSCGCRG